MAGIGHNSGETQSLNPAAKKRLRSFVESVEKLEEEEANLKADKKEIFAQVKAEGFEPKVLKQAIAIRKKDRQKLAEEKALLSLYLGALGSSEYSDDL